MKKFLAALIALSSTTSFAERIGLLVDFDFHPLSCKSIIESEFPYDNIEFISYTDHSQFYQAVINVEIPDTEFFDQLPLKVRLKDSICVEQIVDAIN